MMSFNTVFRRVEIKYLIPEDKVPAFRAAMAPYMQLDEYGLTTIQNIYFDTADNTLISRSLDKPGYKEKLRLRSYGIPGNESTVFVELKKKVDGVVYKRRAAMSLAEANAFLLEGRMPEENSQIIRELAYFRSFYRPVPRLFIAYDREAFFGKQDPGLRMTLDRNIRYREDLLDLTKGDEGRALDENGGCLLEIKCNGAMPLYMTRVLTALRIFPVSFSKYGRIYTVMNHREAHPAEVQSPAGAAQSQPVRAGRRLFTGAMI